ncbi:hypothetical protein DPMN_087603 [Dreissena polymorpha]|uniref:Uncharacterized protein n=1 Tax=Dreissena polymorpha TaxID=45954 RepID=A0A9D4QVR4_DREPO|nr:hypothetical protein DPMN_087603 [Dreissena polymorpha]
MYKTTIITNAIKQIANWKRKYTFGKIELVSSKWSSTKHSMPVMLNTPVSTVLSPYKNTAGIATMIAKMHETRHIVCIRAVFISTTSKVQIARCLSAAMNTNIKTDAATRNTCKDLNVLHASTDGNSYG